MEEVKCPICAHKAVITKTFDYQRVKWYDCELCGYFSLESTTFDLFDFKTYNNRTKLIFAIRKLSNQNNYIKIESIDDLKSIIKRVKFPKSTQDKIDLIIKFIYENNKNRSGYSISEDNGVIFGIKNYDELDLIITLSEDKNYLTFAPKFASGGGLCQLGSEGILRYEELMEESSSQKNDSTNTNNISNNEDDIRDKDRKNTKPQKQRFFKSSNIIYRDKDNIDGVMGVKDLATELSEIIDNLPKEQGRMIGIFGKWGRGKTLLMNETWEKFKNAKNYIKIEFHAWKYQDTPAIWAYLFQHFADSYYSDSKNWFDYFCKRTDLNIRRLGSNQLIFFLISIIASALWMFVVPLMDKVHIIIKLVSTFGIGPLISLVVMYFRFGKSAKDLFVKYYKKVSFSNLLGIQSEVQDEIRILFSEWFKDENDKKILLIVDDIDRCEEDKIIQIIDSLRVMLDDDEISEKVIVVTACDSNILKRAIKNKYSNLLTDNEVDKRNIVNEYLDKIFISAIKLGVLTDDEKDDFFIELSRNDLEKVIDDEANNKLSSDNRGKNNSENSNKTENNPSEEKLNANKNISIKELELLKNGIKDRSQETPRQIRIFYYRYLLAKNLLMLYYNRMNRDAYWLNQNNTKNLISLIILYSQANNSEKITEHKIEISQSDKPKQELHLMNDIEVNQIDHLILLRVLEIVIAY